ncbi:MAG: CRTAC1 family protein [Candidatus Poribacteria bacterium]|nr:CRTAC1 family protein [Candidatus Poribacteria bacterium]
MKIAFLFLVSLFVVSDGSSQPIVKFADVTAESGVMFQHEDGRSYKKYFVETLGSGVALFDYDNDNDVDIYLINGTDLDAPNTITDTVNRLYRNDGTGHFVDVTEESGIGHQGYGVGVCVGDYDNDGWLDVYVTNFGSNALYRNNGDGTFTDRTAESGVQILDWSAGCAFADVDADGDLDLYVANYVNFSVETHTPCRVKGILVYCSPRVYDGVKDVFFRNNGDGTFTENTQDAGFDNFAARGLGVTFADYDTDGDADLYVANDADANFLYNNDGSGRFREQSQFSGVALSEHGLVENGMGVAFGDYDNDTWLDLIVTNFQHQTNTLYHSDMGEFFTDQTYASGTGNISLPYLAWGVNFFDFDHDGFQDVFVANGHIHDNVILIDSSTTYAQLNHLYWNNGNGTFTDVTMQSGPGFTQRRSSRGSAVGDIDNDGDLDLVVSNVGQRIDILQNDGGHRSGNWINLMLVGTTSNRAAIGTRVLMKAGDSSQVREVRSGSSYLSQNDLRLHFGVGTQERVELEIRWQNGSVQRFKNVSVNRFLKIVEGTNQVEPY